MSARIDRELADPYVLSKREQDALLAGAPWSRFVVLGDSVAEGLGDRLPGYGQASWAPRVASALGRARPGLEYLNLGHRGLRAAEVREAQLAPALSFEPDLAAVVCGGNDVLGRRFHAGAVEAELDAMVTALRAAGAEVITFSLLDITQAVPEWEELAERLHELDARVRAVARRHATLHVDAAASPACAEIDVYSADRQHASTRGHAIVASLTIERLGERLGNRVAAGADLARG